MLIIESMDPDTEIRRLSPLGLRGGDTGYGKYIDLINGPMDHGESRNRLLEFLNILHCPRDVSSPSFEFDSCWITLCHNLINCNQPSARHLSIVKIQLTSEML